MSEFQEIIAAEGKQGWKSLWAKEITPWNIGTPAPPLQELVEKYNLLAGQSGLRALVPGCGQGFDVTFLAKQPQVSYACGVDLSPLAIQQARNIAGQQNLPTEVAQKIEFCDLDFFSWQPDQKFNLVLDYTFLCAIDPSLRNEWSAQMSRLISPGGFLITIMYPLSDHTDGPPFALSITEYVLLLLFELYFNCTCTCTYVDMNVCCLKLLKS
jgi:SAM-dependent methyltransferase